MSEPIDIVLWGVALRVLQALIAASPFLLFGLLAAGVLRAMTPPATVRRLAGEDGPANPLATAAFLLLLPWSSLGVLPVARELHRAGVAPWKTLLFIFLAPLSGILCLAYLLSSMAMLYALGTLAACLAVTVTATVASKRWGDAHNRSGPADDQTAATPLGRIGLSIVGAARAAAGPVLLDVAVAMVGLVVVVAFIPDDVLDHGVAKPTAAATPWGIAVGLPAVLSPVHAVMATGVAYSEGNSYGGALAILVLGAGVNLGTLVWVHRQFGLRTMSIWMGSTLLLLLFLGWTADATLPHLRSSLDHHHALSNLGLPDSIGEGSQAPATVGRLLHRDLQDRGALAPAALAVLILFGLTINLSDKHHRLERWLRKGLRTDGAGKPAAWWERGISSRAMAASVCCAFAVVCVAGLFVYFSPPDQLFDDMRCAAADALSAQLVGDHQQAVERADKLVRLTLALRASANLRGRALGTQPRASIADLQSSAETFRQRVASGDKTATKAQCVATLLKIRRCQDLI